MNISRELMSASAVLVVLSVLSKGNHYGYGLIRVARDLSGGRLEWSEGFIYQVLHRLERQGAVESRWNHPKRGGKSRRYYRLTRKGKGVLQTHVEQWALMYLTLARINPDLKNSL